MHAILQSAVDHTQLQGSPEIQKPKARSKRKSEDAATVLVMIQLNHSQAQTYVEAASVHPQNIVKEVTAHAVTHQDKLGPDQVQQQYTLLMITKNFCKKSKIIFLINCHFCVFFSMQTESLPLINHFLSRPSSYIFIQVPLPYLSEFAEHFPEGGNGISDLPAVKRAIFSSSNDENEITPEIQAGAERLYGLAHASFLRTSEGREMMVNRQKEHVFPQCPRLLCKKTTCFPCGVSEVPGTETVKMYCPNCNAIYNVKDEKIKNIDGAYFGLNWLKDVFKEHPELKLSEEVPEYVPTIFGFRIYQHEC